MEIPSQWIAQLLQKDWTSKAPPHFTSISYDSRLIKPGGLFVALKDVRDGHDFVEMAFLAGASGAIVAHPVASQIPQLVVEDPLEALQQLAHLWREKWGQSHPGKLCAITGSAGKTSTKELLAHLLGPHTHKTEANFNNQIGLPLTLLELEDRHTHAVVECGISHIGEMDTLAQICSPNAVILTNIGVAHLEFFKSCQITAREKGQLLQALAPNGIAILHEAELRYEALRRLKSPVFVLGSPDKTDPTPNNYHFVLSRLSQSPYGWELWLDQAHYTLPLWSPGMVRNAAECILLAQLWDIAPSIIQDRLNRWEGVDLRGNWEKLDYTPADTRVWFDAYNANPEALANSLWSFERTTRASVARLYIVGSMAELGEQSDLLHRKAGALIKLAADDQALLIGTYAPELAAGIAQNPHRPSQILIAEDLKQIRTQLKTFHGDVFIKGSHSTGLHTLIK